AYTVLRPREYRSEMDILVENTRADDQITPGPMTRSIADDGVTEEEINSEIQLLQSHGLASGVVDPQWKDGLPANLTEAQYRAHDKAIDNFEKHLSVEMVRKSNVIHVTYVGHDPKTAKDTLNRLLTAFLAKQRELAMPAGTTKFFGDQAARYKAQLDQAQQQLASYQQQHQIVSLTDSEQDTNREIDQAEAELRDTDAQISTAEERIAAGTHQLKSIPPRQATQQRIIPNQSSIEQLNTLLANLENQRTELLTKFTANDRLVQEVDQKIANTRKALNDAKSMTSKETASDVNPVWQTVTASIIQNESDRRALRAKEAALKSQIAGLQSNLSDVEGSTVPFTTLRQKVTDLENNYQLYTQKYDQAAIADAMNANRLLNVAVQESPTYSVIPFRPKPTTDILLGGFTAIFLGCFVVFFAEVGRDTIANAGELERTSMFPVFATVPLDVTRVDDGSALIESGPIFTGMRPSRQISSERRLAPAAKSQQERHAL
ncbi:MAG: GumC family protein, partial [Terracidiphilus sp.]